jgi:predicted MFS family arabinose efflux permease
MRHSSHVRALFVRDFAFTICASALVSLLPLLARNETGSNSLLFGILVGAFGIGGMISGLLSAMDKKSLNRKTHDKCNNNTCHLIDGLVIPT